MRHNLIIAAILKTIVTLFLGVSIAVITITIGSIVKHYFGIAGVCVLLVLPIYAIFRLHLHDIRLKQGIVNNIDKASQELDKLLQILKTRRANDGTKHC